MCAVKATNTVTVTVTATATDTDTHICLNIAEEHVNDGFVYVVVAVSMDFPFDGYLGHTRVENNVRHGKVTCQTYVVQLS